MTALTQTIVKPGSQWQHINQNIYTIVGSGIYVDNCSIVSVSSSRCVRYGKFQFLSASGQEDRPISLFQYGEKLVYPGKDDLDEIVFYYGKSGRWARTKEMFLGKKNNRPRFTEIIYFQSSTAHLSCPITT